MMPRYMMSIGSLLLSEKLIAQTLIKLPLKKGGKALRFHKGVCNYSGLRQRQNKKHKEKWGNGEREKILKEIIIYFPFLIPISPFLLRLT
jgi:hypothetical protein